MNNFERLKLPFAAVRVYEYFKAYIQINEWLWNIPIKLDMKECCDCTGLKTPVKIHQGLHLLLIHNVIIKARDRAYYLNPVYFDKVHDMDLEW